MIAFHGKQEIKDEYLKRVGLHREADELMKGQYWNDGKGCAVGCTIHGSDHSKYETELGIPRILAKLEDGIFERLPNDLAQTWPERFLDAIRPGANLLNIWPKFAVWILVDPEWGVIRFAKREQSKKAIQAVADLYSRKLSGENITISQWNAAAADADAAADAAADADAAAAAYADAAAAYAADAYAADAYADADADAAYAADAYADADAAYAADAYADARTKWRVAQSEKLIELLKETL